MATLHARIDDGMDADDAIAAIQRVLIERFAITHATVQIEVLACARGDCTQAPGPCIGA